MKTVTGMAASWLSAMVRHYPANCFDQDRSVAAIAMTLRSQIHASDMGIVEKLGAGSRQGDAALLQHVGAIGELERRERVLLDQHHRDASGANVLDDPERLLHQRRRQPKGGF